MKQSGERKNRLLSIILCVALALCAVSVGVPSAGAAQGDGITQYYALMVVTSNEDLELSPMHDAQAVTAALTNLKTPDGREIPRENIKIVTEPEVTTNNFSSVLKASFSQMDEDDLGILLYSGHGVYNKGGFSESYLAFQNKVGGWGYYSAASLANTLNAMPGRFLIYLACCYSGGFIAKDPSMPCAQEAPDLLFNRDKFFVISAASALQTDFSEGGALNTDGSVREFASALGVNVQSMFEDGDWLGEEQPMGAFTADTNGDRQLSFYEITQWIKENTVSNSVQCYPEVSHEPLFSYGENDSRPGAVIKDVAVTNQIVAAGETVALEMTCLDGNVPDVYLYCMDRITGQTIAFNYLLPRSLGNKRYRFTANAKSTWAGNAVCFEIYHPKQGVMNRAFSVSPDKKAPASQLKSFDPQPEKITPLNGREYRITLTFDAPCWFDVQICNQQGQVVRTLAEKSMSVLKGEMDSYYRTNSYYWDGADDSGKPVDGGVYQIKARAYNPWGEQSIDGVTAEVESEPAPEVRNITMRVGSTYAVINGNVTRTTINNGVYTTINMVDGKTMVPIRFISEKTHLQVFWDGDAKITTVTNPTTGKYLTIKNGDPTLKRFNADGTLAYERTMEVPPCIIDYSTYVPVRIIAECLGYKVEYLHYTDDNRYVIVSTRSEAFTQDEISAFCAEASGRI